MSEEVLINVTPQETRVAVVENGVLQEVHIERTRNRGIVGNIYIGKVVRVLPGMQAAFVEAGLERTAFLHAGDVGASNLLGAYPELVAEVAMDETDAGHGVLVDVDTPEALAALKEAG